MSPTKQPRFQFSLRAVFVGVTILGVCFVLLANYLRSPPNHIDEADLDRLVERIKPGMTADDITALFGFERDPTGTPGTDYYANHPQWTFYLNDYTSLHGNSVTYTATFVNGQLSWGALFYPM